MSSVTTTRLRAAALGMATALVVLLAPAAPAAAHDQLTGSDPAAGERLDSAPAALTLEYSAEVMELGAMVIVADATRDDWVQEEPVVDGTTVSVPLPAGMPTGGYEIRWRVVSSDGHPISGVIPFTVGDAEPYERTPSEAATPPPASDSPRAQDTQDSQGTQDSGGAARVALLGGGGAAAAVALLAGIHFLRRRKDTADTSERHTL
ncbi:copper resistance CopC family protein [Microbacterium sp. NPDC077184]|uniref:copper resistance CopC family protein n=1 Tax=Microbacterium sp. NPDC077184 TaxID=3154764 RepID=UPI00342124B0